MKEIKYLKGDATKPDAGGNKIIVHICNDMGGWGKGFVMAISKRWPEPEIQYRKWYKTQHDFKLGNVQFVQVEKDIWLANMLGQHKIYTDEKGNPPIRYNAVSEALKKVAAFTHDMHASVHMPRIGSGLAGGTWDKIEPLILEALAKNDIEVTVYDI